MRVVIIGGSGHVGSYLVPRLVTAGHTVVNVSRGQREPYLTHKAWEQVEQVALDRVALERDGIFAKKIAKLNPDVLIDMICFEPKSAVQIVEALKGRVRHYLSCGTIWVHGHTVTAPSTENQPRNPFGDYGVKKAAIEDYLLSEARVNGFPATILHPGHIVGPGWTPLNPAGHFTPSVFETIARGEALTLPNLGLETVHHVHADDVAQSFMNAMTNWSLSVGESFHVVSPQALTLRGYAETMYSWFGKKADLRFLSWEDWRETVSKEESALTWDHIAHSPNCSTDKARRLIDYKPRYSSLEAIKEAVERMIADGVINV